MDEKGEGIEKYKLVVTEQSWGCKVRPREQSRRYSNNYVLDGYKISHGDYFVGCIPGTSIILYVNCDGEIKIII